MKKELSFEEEIDEFLKNMIFPISNEELIEFAEVEGLSEKAKEAINALTDAVYADAIEVKQSIKKGLDDIIKKEKQK